MSAAIPCGAARFASPVSLAPSKAEWEMPPSHRIMGCYFKTSNPQTSHPWQEMETEQPKELSRPDRSANWSKHLNYPIWSSQTMDKEGGGGTSTRRSSQTMASSTILARSTCSPPAMPKAPHCCHPRSCGGTHSSGDVFTRAGPR